MHNGMDALRAIGADRPVIDASFAAYGVELVAPTGETVGRREFDTDGLDGPRTLTRATLYRVPGKSTEVVAWSCPVSSTSHAAAIVRTRDDDTLHATDAAAGIHCHHE